MATEPERGWIERGWGEDLRRRVSWAREHPLRTVAWLFPLAAVYAVFEVLDRVRGQLDLSSPHLVVHALRFVWPPADNTVLAGEMAGRLTWGLTATAFLRAWAVAILVCLWVVHQVLTPHRFGVRTLLWEASFVAAVAWAALGISAGRLPVTIPSLQPVLHVLGQTAPGVEELATQLIRLALIAAIGFTFAGASLLLSTGRAAEEKDAEALRIRVQSLHLLLYSGAAVLVLGVLQVGALHHWALATVPAQEAQPLLPLVNGFSMVIGTYWSLVLLGFYAPVTVLLQLEARRLGAACAETREKVDTEEPRKEKAAPTFQNVREWLDEQGLASKRKQLFVRVGALLGPFLVGGPLGSLVDLLKL